MTTSTPSFLYVEDDAASRRIVSVLLSRVMGFERVTMFDNTANFLTNLRALTAVPNVIFLDIHTRPHDGFEVLRLLRGERAYQDAVVIAMTANVMSHDVELLKKAGFNGLIGKPLLKDTFPQLIEKILAGESIWYVP
jgi:CheY-like chemotaxis protein